MKQIFHIVSNKAWGGGEQYVFDLCQRQLADGIQVAVFCKPVEVIISKFRELNIPVYPMFLNGLIDFKSAWHMGKILHEAGPCTIHAHNFKDAFTAAHARALYGRKDQVRLVMCRHLTRMGKNGLHYRWLYRQLDGLCFDSELSKSIFLSTSPAMDLKKICVVHTSVVVPEDIQAIDLRSRYGIPANTAIAMYHGRLDPEKGLDVLIEATAMLRDKNFRLLLIGRGDEDYTAHLQQLISEKDLIEKVLLLGFQHPVLPFVASADFGLLPSVVREGCPLSPQEYMSQAHPVVATDNGGQQEYIRHRQNGLLVPPSDSTLLAEAMATLIDGVALRRQLGAQAKSDFDNQLSYEHFYRKIQTLYDLAV